MKKNYLFSEIDIHRLVRSQEEALHQEIASLNGNGLLNTSVDDLCAYLVNEYSLSPPEIHDELAVADQKEAKIDVSRHPGRYIRDRSRPFYVSGTKVILEVPFDGEADFFRVQPSSSTLMPPAAEVRDQVLVLSRTGIDLQPEQIKAEFDQDLSEIREHLSRIAADVGQFNSRLPNLARQAVDNRRNKLLADRKLVAAIGYRLKKRDDATATFIVPSAPRKLTLKPPPASTSPYEPEPTMDGKQYQEILDILSNMVQVMERSPGAFRHMDEEGLRTHFLVQLNGLFEGNATGETFNLSGKTDILIRHDGRNLFIAECKFWQGPKMLSETIDQLLGYTNWRDTKTAILVFNRNKDFSKVVNAIPSTVAEHPNFKRQHEYPSETGFQFTFGHRDDANRELLLTVLAFDIPK